MNEHNTQHNQPIYRYIDGTFKHCYNASVTGITSDETGYAVVNTELSQAYIPVYFLGHHKHDSFWVQDAYLQPLTPDEFFALYPQNKKLETTITIATTGIPLLDQYLTEIEEEDKQS